MSEISEKIAEQIEHTENTKLNSKIALIVSICACMMAVFNIKDNNIVQAMEQAQARTIDAWSYYQAKSLKQGIAENNLDFLKIGLEMADKSNRPLIAKMNNLINLDSEKIKRYEQEKSDIKLQAENFQKEYDSLNMHDDQFDLAEALLSLALSLLGITALTQKRMLFYFSVSFASIGIFFGIAGFLNLSVHPEFIMKFLS